MYKLKGCPRCRGDLLIVQEDIWFEQCIQCGYERELKVIVDVSRKTAPMKKQF